MPTLLSPHMQMGTCAYVYRYIGMHACGMLAGRWMPWQQRACRKLSCLPAHPAAWQPTHLC